ncbi:MAG: alanine racemase [Porticoccaceae bacterium]|nr:alanine racemase [Porticoccaceae bacterium]
MSRPTKAIIDLQALRHNFMLAQSLAAQSKTIPMVKANAYGHGAIEVSAALADIAPALGVASIEEAIELRESGIELPILLLEGTFSSDEVDIAAQHNFWLMVENRPQVEAILNASLARKVNVWLGIDSGMHRLGFQPDEIQSAYDDLSGSHNVSDEIVVCSHFACADDLDNKATLAQIKIFDLHLPKADNAPLKSLANSAAILGWPQAQRDWQRPGYMLYGNSPFAQSQENADQLKPVMCFESAVISVRSISAGESVGYTANWTAARDSTIATVTVGYGDGYPRQAPNGTPVLINGTGCPLVGRVSMDMITVDVTDLDAVAIGDRAVLWGPELPVNEIAELCGTIGYELLTRMPARVPRVYR